MDGNFFATNEMGWVSHDDTRTQVETDLAVSPDNLLSIVSCGCKEDGCGTMPCECKKLGMFCTLMINNTVTFITHARAHTHARRHTHTPIHTHSHKH